MVNWRGLRIIRDYNTGDNNAGYWNTGDYNAGDCNTGYMNGGDFNTGEFNTGKGNTGSRNAGDYNTGDYNIGGFNTGDWNAGCRLSGVFCTGEEAIYMFNKPTSYTYKDWTESQACKILKRTRTVQWIDAASMTKVEKKRTPSYGKYGGYLKVYTLREGCRELWNSLSPMEREIIKSMPNFDGVIFKQVTGIDVEIE